MIVRRNKAATVVAIVSLQLAGLFPVVARSQAGMAQFCSAVGTFDRTMYFAEAEEREDRESQFIELLTISGVEFTLARCVTQTIELHRTVLDLFALTPRLSEPSMPVCDRAAGCRPNRFALVLNGGLAGIDPRSNRTAGFLSRTAWTRTE